MLSTGESTPLDQQAESVRLAYDRIAPTYEQDVAGDDWMRQILRRHYLTTFRAGERVLDVACGTGLDSVHLAQHGIRVTAIDISPEMIERLQARAMAACLTDVIDARVLSIDQLSELPAESFDGIVSAFAGLSTSPDLRNFARESARLLRPNGRMLLHLLNRFSLWEWLTLVKSRRWSEARSLGRSSDRDFVIGGITVQHYMHQPDALYRSVFAERFKLNLAYGLGCLRPPHTVRAIPMPIVGALAALDAGFGGCRPFRNHGRFFVLDLAKRPDDGLAERP